MAAPGHRRSCLTACTMAWDRGGRLLLPDHPDWRSSSFRVVRASLRSPHRCARRRAAVALHGRWPLATEGGREGEEEKEGKRQGESHSHAFQRSSCAAAVQPERSIPSRPLAGARAGGGRRAARHRAGPGRAGPGWPQRAAQAPYSIALICPVLDRADLLGCRWWRADAAAGRCRLAGCITRKSLRVL
jgi:hypothetical protein